MISFDTLFELIIIQSLVLYMYFKPFKKLLFTYPFLLPPKKNIIN